MHSNVATPEDMRVWLGQLADTLSVSTLPDARLERMAQVWANKMAYTHRETVRAAFRVLEDDYEGRGMPDVRDLKKAADVVRSRKRHEYKAPLSDPDRCPVCGAAYRYAGFQMPDSVVARLRCDCPQPSARWVATMDPWPERTDAPTTDWEGKLAVLRGAPRGGRPVTIAAIEPGDAWEGA
jgi:hypothetical protein